MHRQRWAACCLLCGQLDGGWAHCCLNIHVAVAFIHHCPPTTLQARARTSWTRAGPRAPTPAATPSCRHAAGVGPGVWTTVGACSSCNCCVQQSAAQLDAAAVVACGSPARLCGNQLFDPPRRPCPARPTCPCPVLSPRTLLQDIGVFLRDVFRQRFKGVDIKYIGEAGWESGEEWSREGCASAHAHSAVLRCCGSSVTVTGDAPARGCCEQRRVHLSSPAP